MVSKRTRFVQESVIGLGFLNGMWLRFGINPEDEIFKSVVSFISLFSEQYAIWLSGAFAILSFALLAVSLVSAYARAGRAGLLAVGLAIAGGFLLGQLGIAFLIIAILLGFISCK